MTTAELKEQLLKMSFGGVMYDVTKGNNVTTLVLNNEAIANMLVEQLDVPEANGIDKGLKNFILEVIAKDMAEV